MKKNILTMLVLVLAWISSPLIAQQKGVSSKNYLGKQLKVTKLMVEGEDKTDKLAMVKITKTFWEEYDHDNKLIGKAEIVKMTGEAIKIKWLMTENGATVGDYTNYELSIKRGLVLNFKIHFDGEDKGYFEVEL